MISSRHTLSLSWFALSSYCYHSFTPVRHFLSLYIDFFLKIRAVWYGHFSGTITRKVIDESVQLYLICLGICLTLKFTCGVSGLHVREKFCHNMLGSQHFAPICSPDIPAVNFRQEFRNTSIEKINSLLLYVRILFKPPMMMKYVTTKVN